MKHVVYIAGPYSPSNGLSMKSNTYFAEQVGRFAQKKGMAPIVPHSSILAGVYGDDLDDHERNEGVASTMSILELVARDPKSELWVIADNIDGELVLSTGTQMEVDRWEELKGRGSIMILDRSGWSSFIIETNKEYTHG